MLHLRDTACPRARPARLARLPCLRLPPFPTAELPRGLPFPQCPVLSFTRQWPMEDAKVVGGRASAKALATVLVPPPLCGAPHLVNLPWRLALLPRWLASVLV